MTKFGIYTLDVLRPLVLGLCTAVFPLLPSWSDKQASVKRRQPGIGPASMPSGCFVGIVCLNCVCDDWAGKRSNTDFVLLSVESTF